ncbi:metal-sensing transcriptional repressor [Paucibacter sp. O1-1]|nr:metal-sensing transcriptional repressor [Paucibacter sp. O1-1]MDA3824359.1 metal-sensing transcriptional repressor [Paucibacter sp. O1-1]
MIEGGEPCLDIAGQMAAVRKALDSAYAHDGVLHAAGAAQPPVTRRQGAKPS